MALKRNAQMHREFHINSVDSDSGNFITLSLSSEYPAPREFGNEVLLHGPENIDMSRAGQPSGLPLLLNHQKEALPTGRLKNFRVGEDRKLRADAYFSGSELGQQVKKDVQAGIITDTSLGYLVKDFKVVRDPKGGPDTYNVTRWMPFEGSLVGVPMDPGVGVGRSLGGDLNADLDGQDQPAPQPSDGTLATGLGEGSAGDSGALETPDLQLGEDARALRAARRAELLRELGLLDGMIDLATAPDGNLENVSDSGVDPAAGAAQTSEASSPTAVATESDDDNCLYYQRSADFTDAPRDADEERAEKEPYGDVDYADPGYQADGKKRYPIDSKEHALAANSYIHKKLNAAKYSPADLKKVVARIEAALHKFGVDQSETKSLEPCGTAEDTRMLGGDKPAPVVAELADPSLTGSAPGTVDLIDSPAPVAQPHPADPKRPEAEPAPDLQAEPNPGLLEVAPETVALLGAPKPDQPPIDGIGELNPDQNRAMTVDSELLGSPGGLGNPEVIALRAIALKVNQTRTASEIDRILSTRSLSEARSLLLKAPEPPSKMVRYEPGRPKMLTNQLLNRAMSECVKGNWSALDADDGSVKEVLKRIGERAFTVDLFHESVGGSDFQAARRRFLQGGQQLQRDMTTSTDSNAVFQVPIGFIDYLFARTALLKAGARIKTGVGSLSYIRISSPIAQTAQAEDTTTPAATGVSFTKVPYLPHAIVAKVPVTQELQKESAFDLQPIIRQDVSKQFAVAMDSVGLNGVTSPYTQQGILQAGNSTQQNLAASTVPAFTDVNQLKATVDKVSVDLDTCAYITSPQLFALLETTPKFSGGTGWPIADRNQINGYKGFTTTNMPNNQCSGGTLSVTTGGVMTLVAAPTTGAVALNQRIIATGIPTGAYIGSLLTGTLGANGSTYQLLLNGANAACTTESTESFVGAGYSLLFGDFSLFEFCFQGPLEVMVDDITMFEMGITNLKFRQYFDTGILQQVAFAHCDNYELTNS